MAEEEKTKEDLEVDIVLEKKARKILIICSAVCCVIGIIAGVGLAVEGDSSFVWTTIWISIGLGGALTKLPIFSVAHLSASKGGGIIETLSAIFWIALFLVFLFAGPVGLLIRILRMSIRINKFEEQLSALG